MYNRIIYLILLMLIQDLSYAQKIIFRGKLYDKESNKPLKYANIYLKHKQYIGVISNDEGVFSFMLPSSQKLDTVVFSHMGYLNKELPIVELLTNNNIINLEPLNIIIQHNARSHVKLNIQIR